MQRDYSLNINYILSEAHSLAQAYEPLEPFIMMADSGKPFEQHEVLFDFVQTVTRGS